MSNKIYAFAAAAAAALTMSFAAATPASAALVLAVGEEDCNLYSAQGCLFTYDNGDGNIFDDPDAFEAAYNAAHNATPPPENLPDLFFLGKAEDGGSVPFDKISGVEWKFEDLPWNVSFYTIKAGSGQVLLFGLDPASDTFNAKNLTIVNPRNGNARDISHVTFFGTDGGGLNEVPEPGTWALMITGFGAAGAMLRRRKAALA